MNDDSIAGYLSIRTLAESFSSRLVLARAHSDGERDESSSVYAIKRFSPDALALRTLTEIECLALAQGDHTVPVEDVGAAPDGVPALITQWQTASTLRRVMRERQTLRPGEAITILAPLATALNRVHHAGVTLGNVTMDAVHFDSAGAPFFADFSSARLHGSVPTPAELCDSAWFHQDRQAYAVVASGVLAAVSLEHNVRTPMAELLSWLSSDTHFRTSDWQRECERRLFALGAPEPVRLGVIEATEALNPAQLTRSSGALADAALLQPRTELDSVLALPPWLQGRLAELMAEIKHRAANGIVGLRDWCRPIRKRTWALASAGALCVVLAVVVASLENTETSTAVASTGGESSAVAPGDESEPRGAAPDAVRSPETDPQAAHPEATQDTLLADPAQALELLLTTRNLCLRDLSIECLAAVARADSPAFAADSALITNVLNGAELSPEMLITAEDAVEIQRLGDSVLFEFSAADESKPASLLLVKGEAGWRIRSYTLPE
ncbi:hypothetical protein I6E74_07820 [Salinibacterium sp. SWN139]|uniref:hypothetical protein n=1 Tax=Salinibacterium sp. SWN139 TaxID=2792055 RepID=UPI0018CFEA6B|nr:hypothetical protein [Salinibacterium sp. SWN139]MBH0054074.1 hypothetical protein [Salinibacterium sp. SWN139]